MMLAKKIRVRFAPSPTGDLHLGGLRTALYNFLFAKKTNGVFILRCEDTDQVRLVPGAMERMIELLQWAGVNPDEGPVIGGSYGPYIQSQRLELYRTWVKFLLREGHAYKCFCSPQRLELLRKDQLKRREVFQGYDNLCRTLTDAKVSEKLSSRSPYTIRFKLSNDEQRYKDLVYGEISTDVTHSEGDPVILKSDGYPTYHLANVVDDHLMEITHVLRGAEWQSSTPKHLQLFSAFNWTPPAYAHLPLLLNADGTKLSKRQDSLKVQYLKDKGYEPESIISLLCLAGGGVSLPHKEINEDGVMLEKAAKNFSIENIRTQNSVLNMERLPQLNQSLLHRLYKTETKQSFMNRLIARISVLRNSGSINSTSHIHEVIESVYENFPKYVDRLCTFDDLYSGEFSFLWNRPSLTDLESVLRTHSIANEKYISLIDIIQKEIRDNQKITDEILSKTMESSGFKKSVFFKLLRKTLSGSEVGAPVLMMFELLGSNEVIQRCQNAKHILLERRASIPSSPG